jgi:small subunit ribosomal protein S8
MAMSDLLSDVLTRVRNGQKAGHAFVVAPSSKLVKSALEVLISEGYIENYEEFEERTGVKQLKITLKYFAGKPVIKLLKRISKPGRRMYTGAQDLPRSHGGLGTFIVSTSSGVMPDHEARQKNLGGELLCEVF